MECAAWSSGGLHLQFPNARLKTTAQTPSQAHLIMEWTTIQLRDRWQKDAVRSDATLTAELQKPQMLQITTTSQASNLDRKAGGAKMVAEPWR